MKVMIDLSIKSFFQLIKTLLISFVIFVIISAMFFGMTYITFNAVYDSVILTNSFIIILSTVSIIVGDFISKNYK
jgi:Na+(H+)/acetate symporter ActP